MKEYLFDRSTGEFVREQEMHIDPLRSKAVGRAVYLLSANATEIAPPERKEGYAVVWNGNSWSHVEDHRGVTVWESYEESTVIEDLGPIPEGWSTDRPEKPLTVDDYDRAMEAYIAKVRIDRGYTLREPSNFTDSRNARWAQDAVDFILFRDQVLEYGQEVMNHYTSTGEAPTLEAFKLALSLIKCEWSYTE